MHCDLIERLEKLTGPDREMDCLIWAAMDGRTVREQGNKILARNSRPPHDGCVLGFIDRGESQRNFTPAWSDPPFPPYTTSLDAAVALVERCLPGWSYSIQRSDFGKGPFSVCRVAKATETYDAIHDCSAIALLIALLRALSKGGSRDG